MKRYLLKQSIIKQPAESFLAKVLLVSFCMCLPLVSMRGQQQISLDVPRIVPVSPEATMMEKFQSYPVDLCTGVPDITIPLYEIVAGDITIPITLNYHASGLKPKERSGLAGTGWTLNLEPSIMREIKGVPDDSQYGWFNNRYASAPTDAVERVDFYNKKVDNVYDTQPDKFVYRLPNGGGSGYFMESFSAMRCIPMTNDDVRFGYGNMDITGADGTVYEFHGVNEKTGDYITRWMCTAIRSPRHPDRPVTFEYATISNELPPSAYFNMDNRIVINSVGGSNPELLLCKQTNNNTLHYRVGFSSSPGTSPYPSTLTSITASEAGVTYPAVSSYVTERGIEARLQKICFYGNTLTVSYGYSGAPVDGRATYDKIEVTDRNGNILRTIEFDISLYNSNTSLTKLDAVHISAPGVEPRSYTFEYKNINSVPSIYTTGIDHWGYCNGPERGEGIETVPSFKRTLFVPNGIGGGTEVLFEHTGNNREPDAEWASSGILRCITDPQGIQTSFSYEGNYGGFRYTQQNNSNYLHPVGGVRVKEITVTDPHTNRRTIKSYRYGLTKLGLPGYTPIWGGGAIKHIVSYRDYQSGFSMLMFDNASASSWLDNLTVFRSMPHSNITFNNGSAVMYNIVQEKIVGTDMDSLRTDYYYNVSAHQFEDVLTWYNGQHDIVPYFLENQSETVLRKVFRPFPGHPQEPSDDLLRHPSNSFQPYGRLARKECFRHGELVSRTEYSYEKKSSLSSVFVDIPVRLISIDKDIYQQYHSAIDLDFSDCFVISNYYTPSTSDDPVQTEYFLDVENYCVLDKETTTRYYVQGTQRDSVVTFKEYEYDIRFGYPEYSLEPTKVTQTNSNGVTVSDEYGYLTGYPAILSEHRHSEGEDFNESRILFRSGTCFPERVQSRTDRTGGYRDEVVYSRYDAHNNVVQIAGKDGTPITFLWSYEDRFPIAKIVNATRAEVLEGFGLSASSESTLDAWANFIAPSEELLSQIAALRESLPNAQVTVYEYDPNRGLTAVTDPNGVKTCFEYDGYNRLTESYYYDPDLQKVMLQEYVYKF